MHAFITKAEVEEEDDDYKQDIQEFEVDVKHFYEYGRTTFLASRSGEQNWKPGRNVILT